MRAMVRRIGLDRLWPALESLPGRKLREAGGDLWGKRYLASGANGWPVGSAVLSACTMREFWRVLEYVGRHSVM